MMQQYEHLKTMHRLAECAYMETKRNYLSRSEAQTLQEILDELQEHLNAIKSEINKSDTDNR